MIQRENSTLAPDDADPLLKAAEDRLLDLNKWGPRLWAWNCWLTGTAVILSGLVPFGLGLLLYTPPEHARTLNIALIVAAAIGFVAEVWNLTQRNRDRARHLRAIASELELAVASYRSGLVGREDFADTLKKALERYAQEPAP